MMPRGPERSEGAERRERGWGPASGVKMMTPRDPERSEGVERRSAGGGAPAHWKDEDR